MPEQSARRQPLPSLGEAEPYTSRCRGRDIWDLVTYTSIHHTFRHLRNHLRTRARTWAHNLSPRRHLPPRVGRIQHLAPSRAPKAPYSPIPLGRDHFQLPPTVLLGLQLALVGRLVLLGPTVSLKTPLDPSADGKYY